jgi:plasmid stabilization system protein ParE
MSRYTLTPTAQADLVDIRDHYLEEAGRRVAHQMVVEFVEAFKFPARNPNSGHKREDLAGDRAVLFWAMRDYLILYRPNTRPLIIATIVRGTREVLRIISRLGFPLKASRAPRRYQRETYRIHLRKPICVLASMILPLTICSSISFAVNQRFSIRSSSIGVASPSVNSVAR